VLLHAECSAFSQDLATQWSHKPVLFWKPINVFAVIVQCGLSNIMLVLLLSAACMTGDDLDFKLDYYLTIQGEA